MCVQKSDNTSNRNSIDAFLSNDYKVPVELQRAMEDEIEYSSFIKTVQKIKLDELKKVIMKQIDNNTEDELDIEILNGWEFTEKQNINPTMKKYILTVVAITQK